MKLLGDRIVLRIEKEKEEETTPGGIIISKKEKPDVPIRNAEIIDAASETGFVPGDKVVVNIHETDGMMWNGEYCRITLSKFIIARE